MCLLLLLLCSDAGQFIRKNMLEYGSSRPSAPLLREVAGGVLDPSFYLSDILKK